ncbi:MAG: class II glutamine amidotransferase [Pseudaminobacter sp.]|nr:class II glutamine amidotransferase [Pseudaminobacter sp.]
MCRWAAYLGPDVFLEDIVTAPCHSLVAQSHHALEARCATNGDGFGVAWYGQHPEPGLYRDILPAWSDPNLKSLCRQIRSGLFLAHVRASTGGATSRANCHPFVSGRWSFMHNGQIAEFDRIRRPLQSSLGDGLYGELQGTTDSELFFLLMLEEGLEADPFRAAGRATAKVIEAARQAGIEPSLRLTAAFADGETLYAMRYATDAHAPTLYAGSLQAFGGRCLVSEPFDPEGPSWQPIPPASFVTMTRRGMSVRPFAPEQLCAMPPATTLSRRSRTG